MIKELSKIPQKEIFLEKDINGREISIYKLEDSVVASLSDLYPNILLYSHKLQATYNPTKESIMSLNGNVISPEVKEDISYNNTINTPVFFFIYNTDNYYHFVYDTLPYIFTFLDLRKKIPNIKLLMSNKGKDVTQFYRFVTEFLELCDISLNDIALIDNNTLYKEIYISNSYTHDIDSNLPPRKEIYTLYNKLVGKVKHQAISLPSKIYISRRTWMHNNTSNIGTNYTTRRKLYNEDELVRILKGKKIEEVFTENLTTIEKLVMFSRAEKIVGAIGGGLCNALFSPSSADLLILVSPTFLDRHERFKFSFTGKQTTYFCDAHHIESGYWKRYMRVRIPNKNIIGEIEEINNDTLLISYASEPVAGWNKSFKFEKGLFNKSECVRIDDGLNCGWKINLDKLEALL